MIPLDEARDYVRARTPSPVVERVALGDALGLVVAEAIVATESIPPFDNTAVDGFALVSEDTQETPSRLLIVGEVRAGADGNVPLTRGQAVRIMTGAPIPPGADAVVMVEDTEIDGDEVLVGVTVAPGSAIRPAGDDVKPGDTVIAPGTILRATHLGLLAELGLLEVPVYRRPRVGIITTGDELVGDGSALLPGQIRESNTHLLIALVTQAGCVPVDFGIVRDDVEAITDVLEHAVQGCDAILTSGGVSMGDYDLIKVVLEKLGEMQWMQILIKPAKPFAFGVLGRNADATPVFGLPGNPVSSFVSFELLARPALRSMMGDPEPARPMLRAIADEAMTKSAGDQRLHFIRVAGHFADDGRLHVCQTGSQGSHQLAASAAANGLARLDGAGVQAGDEVSVLYLD